MSYADALKEREDNKRGMGALYLNIGMPTLIELNTIEENIKLCKDLGLNFIEINLNLPQYQVDRLKASELLLLQQKHDIFFTFHLPEDLEIAHFNKMIRDAHWKTVFEVIDIMKRIGSKIMNMHMSKGIHFTLPSKKVFLYEKYNMEYCQTFKSFAKQVIERIGQYPIKVAIENTGVYDKQFITSIMDELLKDDGFALTWDIGHDYSSGNLDKDYILKNINKLKHMHLHDARGQQNHMVLYDGDLDINKYIDLAYKEEYSVVIETKTIEALKESICRLRQSGYSF
ncbi:sugar phosphate isomerase/epimerase family protein [Vallitalea okinawensis]|uniref:sugar phosphate isomerase/epimerase family protein n=1 Tax=Vallitalea okinawensis TaxID=2078660 RepID=UPI000CFB7874|nr:sugar phosphate isomerase/epimerase [Vallitalea okinawensis]